MILFKSWNAVRRQSITYVQRNIRIHSSQTWKRPIFRIILLDDQWAPMYRAFFQSIYLGTQAACPSTPLPNRADTVQSYFPLKQPQAQT